MKSIFWLKTAMSGLRLNIDQILSTVLLGCPLKFRNNGSLLPSLVTPVHAVSLWRRLSEQRIDILLASILFKVVFVLYLKNTAVSSILRNGLHITVPYGHGEPNLAISSFINSWRIDSRCPLRFWLVLVVIQELSFHFFSKGYTQYVSFSGLYL